MPCRALLLSLRNSRRNPLQGCLTQVRSPTAGSDSGLGAGNLHLEQIPTLLGWDPTLRTTSTELGAPLFPVGTDLSHQEEKTP